MAYEMVMPYHLHMPSYFLETFTEYPNLSGCSLLFWNLCISYKLLFHTVAVAAHELVYTTSCIY